MKGKIIRPQFFLVDRVNNSTRAVWLVFVSLNIQILGHSFQSLNQYN